MKIAPNDWRVRLAAALGCGAFGAVALFVVKPLVQLPPWWGLIAFVAMIGVGTALGQFVGRRLFRLPSEDSPATTDDQPQQPGPPP